MKRIVKAALRQIGYEIRRIRPAVAASPAKVYEPLRPVDGKASRADAANAVIRQLLAAKVAIDWEPVLEAAYRRLIRPGDVVIDLGAHAGRHTAVFLELVGAQGAVHAFEPIPHLAANLAQRVGNPPNLTVTAAALSNASGSTTFKYAQHMPQESGLRERIYNAPNPGVIDITVEVKRLDEYHTAWPKVDYIKIDIEGGEIGCLDGASALLAARRPILSVEYGAPGYSQYGHQRDTLFRWAEAHRYVMADLFGNLIPTEAEWNRLCDTVYWDFFMFPQERAASLEAQLLSP